MQACKKNDPLYIKRERYSGDFCGLVKIKLKSGYIKKMLKNALEESI